MSDTAVKEMFDNAQDAQAFAKVAATNVTDVTGNEINDLGVTSDDAKGVTPVTQARIPCADHRPCFKVFDERLEAGGEKYRAGVWYFGKKETRDDVVLTKQWVCTPVHLEAITHDSTDNNFGRLLKFSNSLNRWHEWSMPMELLRGAGDELRGELLAMGVEIDPQARTLFGNYLLSFHPKRRMQCALQTGWCGNSFVLPDVVIGQRANEIIFQSGERGQETHTRAGTLALWQRDIAARATNNPLMILALSSAFAGPLINVCNGESGGFHFVGDSSTGKTSLIKGSCSVWGGENFMGSWRATANGLEGVAALSNDCLLALDEISQCDPREVGSIIYSLGNGRGKQRASRTGTARGTMKWRCFILSNGERSIATTMSEGGFRAKAGQGVRIVDLPVQRQYGAFDDLHGLPSGAAFADSIKTTAKANHGHAGRAFLEKLTSDKRDFCSYLERIKSLPEFSTEGDEGQDKRVASRFALAALAGELATEYEVTGWLEGTAIAAASESFRIWQAQRGKGNDERRQVLARLADFIDRHNDARFSSVDSTANTNIRDRAGWWRDDEATGRQYLFTSDGLHEALKGFDFKRTLDLLQSIGALCAEPNGERSKAQRISGRLVRVYTIHADRLDGGSHGA